MADTKISALTAGTAAPGDEIPVNRGGVNYKITAGDILKQDSGTLTASAPALDLTQTWNAGGVTFTGLKFNATDTASASGSLLMDLQVGGTSKFSVDKSGVLRFAGGLLGSGVNDVGPINVGNTLYTVFANRVAIAGASAFAWTNSNSSPSATADLFLYRDTSNTLAQRNSTNAQTFRIYNTYTDASNYERGKIQWDSNVLKIGTEKAGTGTARALELQTDGTTRLTISSSGTVTSGPIGIGTFRFHISTSRCLSFASDPSQTGANGVTSIYSAANAVLCIGAGSNALGDAGAMELKEMTAPAAPASNAVRIYAEDDGAGKTRLMALFPTGAAQQIAIEP